MFHLQNYPINFNVICQFVCVCGGGVEGRENYKLSGEFNFGSYQTVVLVLHESELFRLSQILFTVQKIST
jgi:hypothetical protein